MARKIDWSKPVSDEDRAWAQQRLDTTSGQDGLTIGEQLERNDIEHGKASKDSKKTRAERLDDLRTTIANAENEMSRLQLEQAEEDRQNAAFSGTPEDARKGLGFVDNTPVEGEAPQGADTGKKNYSNWTVPDLQQEITLRNDDRKQAGVEPLSIHGKKSELVERIEQDDREIAEAGE